LSAASGIALVLEPFGSCRAREFECGGSAEGREISGVAGLERERKRGVGRPDLWMGLGAGSATGNGLRDLACELRFTEGGGRKRLYGCE
jgi:hypothetical protein